jgi:hypothetical protein
VSEESLTCAVRRSRWPNLSALDSDILFAFIFKLTALLLWGAGALKAYSAASSPLNAVDYWFTIALAIAEIAFGCWLFVSMFPRATRCAALFCFLCLLGISLAKAVNGERSCGCFGPLSVSPWVTAGLDALVLAALAWAKPETKANATGRPWAAFALLSGASIAFTVALIFLASPAQLNANGNVEGNAATVALRPEEWIGQPCPLIPQMDIGSRLQRGEWVVLLHRAGCDVCREMMPRYLARVADSRKRSAGPGWALIEVPGEGESAAESWVAPGLLSGRLSETRRWVVQTPIILRLEDGVVTQVTHSLEEVRE